MKRQVGTIHIVPGEGIVNTVRQAYWYENRQEWALDVLSCYEGITDEQRMTILRGDATLRPVITTYGVGDPVTIQYIEEPNIRFKQELEKHLVWIKEDCYVFAGKHVNKGVVDPYIDQLRKLYKTAVINPTFFTKMQRIMKLRMTLAEDSLNRILKSASIKNHEGLLYEKLMAELNFLVFNEWTQRCLERINEDNRDGVIPMIEDIQSGRWVEWGRYSWELSWEERCELRQEQTHKNLIVTEVDLRNAKIWSLEVPNVKHQTGINYKTPKNRKEWAKNIYTILFTHAYSGMDKDLAQRVIDEGITYFETYDLPDLRWWLKQLKVDILNDTIFTHKVFGTEVTQFNSLRGMFHDEILNPSECPHTSGTRRAITKHRKVLEVNET